MYIFADGGGMDFGVIKLVIFFRRHKFMNPLEMQKTKKLSFRIHGHMKILSDKPSPSPYITIYPPYAVVFEISVRVKLGIREKETIRT